MNDVGLVQTVLDLTGFDLLDGSGDVRGDGAGLRGGHEACLLYTSPGCQRPRHRIEQVERGDGPDGGEDRVDPDHAEHALSLIHI